MKLLFIFLALFLGNNCFSQSLEGVWKGSWTYYYRSSKFPGRDFQTGNNPIKLQFVLNPDSSYSVYSFTKGLNSKGKDTTFVRSVFYRKISEDSIYLEEIRIVKPENVPRGCMQKMVLKRGKRKRSITLEGTWDSRECTRRGEIVLYKRIS